MALRDAIGRTGRGTLALSGGTTAPALIDHLVGSGLDWSAVEVWQVDERVAPDGHPDRNANQLVGLPAGCVHLMPVTASDLMTGAAAYAASLPECFDVVHLGLGDDGHTASWPPGDAVTLDSDLDVVVTAPFHGRRRMTLTPVVVNAARLRVVLVTGSSKAGALAAWRHGTAPLPASRIRPDHTVVVCDAAAASGP
jgi:6-phosphogluconolactonase/glucosamine-6-phosphate isomerase/deaminase